MLCISTKSPQFREWKSNSELIVEKMKSKNILFGSGSSNLSSPRHQTQQTQPPEPKQTLCYEEVKRVENFRRKTLILIGAHGVGRRNIKNMLIQIDEKSETQYAYPGQLFIFSHLINCFSVPHTTRPPRPGEVHGSEYFFIDFGKIKSLFFT